jgi:hypothetical protein
LSGVAFRTPRLENKARRPGFEENLAHALWRGIVPSEDDMTPADNFEYDVAFSFHSLDESIAFQLNDRLQDRYRTFLYSEQQKVLAGRNGEDKFNEIFGKKARFVVVLFRKEWGETPFTKIEQRAIRDRAYDDGYDFTLFIPTEKKPTMPPWVERTRLYFSFERYGVDGAAAVVESKLQELGLSPTVEGSRERAQRLQRSLNFKSEKETFERSVEGVQAGLAAYKRIMQLIKSAVDEVSASNASLRRMKMELYGSWLLHGLGPFLLFNWTNLYSNVLDNTFLEGQFFRNQPALPGLMTWDEPKKMKLLRYGFELLRPGASGFVARGSSRREFNEAELAEHILKAYMDEAEKFKR